MADLAVIIVSYNCAEWLPACLTSVYARAGSADVEVVVVDNDSTDGSAELVERDFPAVRVLRCENRGFAYANNRGLEAVNAPYVLFLNADTEILSGTFGELLTLLDSRPGVGLVGCRQVTPDGVVYPTIRRFPTPTRHFFEALGSEKFPFRASWLGERELDPAAYARECSCDWTQGSFMLARREAVIDAGGMDERYFIYCEEPDLCLRIRRLGWEIRHLPAMTILHHAGKAGWTERLVAQDAYARRQYMLKNFSPSQRRLALAAFTLKHLLRAGYLTSDPDLRRDRRACARAALRILFGLAPGPFVQMSGAAPPRRLVAGQSLE